MNRLLFTFTFLLIFCINLPAQPKHEIRAVWLTTNFGLDWPGQSSFSTYDTETHKRDLYLILDKLKEANFNVVFVQARIRGDVIYSSEIEPKSKFMKIRSSADEFDPLEFVTEACHERGLECHAWFVAYPLGISLKKGQKIPDRKNIVKKFDGEYYLDPGNPQTNTYLLSLITEIVENYDIDGFHFDYVRYPDKSDKFPDKDSYRKYGGRKNIGDWRRENVNQLVYKAYDRIKSLKPWVQVSSSVLGMYKKIPGNTQAHWTAYESVFQDPVDWINKGKHDFIVPMMYYSGDLFYPFIHDWLQYRGDRFVVPGIGLYRMDEEDADWNAQKIVEQVRYSRENKTQGNAYFRTKYLIDNKKKILDLITTEFYTMPAQLPALTWIDSVAPLNTCKPDAIGVNGTLFLSWDDISQNAEEKIYYSIYRSETFPVDIENVENLVATRIPRSTYSLNFDPAVESGYYYVVTSNDRFHNESIASDPAYFCTGNFEK